jgi:hypothetical protein
LLLPTRSIGNLQHKMQGLNLSIFTHHLKNDRVLGGKAAEKATESAAGKFGEASWGKAQAIWTKLNPKVEAKEAALEAATDVANAPEDKDLQVALRVQLKKLLEQDEALERAIAQIFQEDGPDGTPGVQIVQTVTGDQNQVIGQVTGGKVIGNITGDLTM